MCIDRNWFSTYQSIDDSVVFMGNDISCKIVWVDSIQVKIYDGIVITLTYVMHVPELRKNLITFGFLYSGVYKYIV